MSRVANRAVLPRSDSPWLEQLEHATPAIREELNALLKTREVLPRFQDVAANQSRISADDRWRIFALCGFGRRSELGASLCPRTAEVLDRIEGVESAFFSVLAPGKHIPRHHGVTRALLRCHLGLIVPSHGRCMMAVGDDRVVWREGEAVVFDDTQPHEVWNDTPYERVVLLIDVRRPMRWPGRLLYALMRAILGRTHFVRDAVHNQLAWERKAGPVLKERIHRAA